MRTHVIKSYAKINIGLSVTGKRKDGYHELDMVMVPLKLHDTIIFKQVYNRDHDNVMLDDFSLIIERKNSVTQAIELFNKNTNLKKHFSVLIHKVIPVQGGFGGGSSNAAATMLLMNKLFKANYSQDKLKEMALTIGADVPFFIDNVPARCRGVGEKMEPIKIMNDYYVLIVKPDEGCSTKEVFSKCDDLNLKTCDIDSVVKALESGDDDLLANSISNSLEDAAINVVPKIKTCITELKNAGFKIVSMTGSGSGVYALSTDKKLVNIVKRQLENKYTVEVTKIIR